jgi:two-component system, chemotaxis family, response regulator PixG
VEKLSPKQLLVRLQAIKNSQLTGTYTLYPTVGQPWKLFFLLGRLTWCSGGEHRFRRWYRCLRQSCPDLDPRSIRLRDQTNLEEWEYHAIAILVARQQISREQGVSIIQQAMIEVNFDILQSFEGNNRLMGAFATSTADEAIEPLSLLDPEQTLNQAQKLWDSWFSAGFAAISPNLAPVLKQPETLEKQLSGNTYLSLKSIVNGNLSLRDLAIQMKQDLLIITRSFSPYFQQGMMGLQTMADLPEPNYQLTELNVTVSANQPLIICIDDSLDVCNTMSAVLTQAGYRFISIHDAFQALPTLLAQKPSFIFLDLVMPIASGYEICSQIRRVSAFKDVPVVILTGNDGIIDRVRAKMVGASDFLSKPIDSDKILTTIRRYLGHSIAPSEPL